MSNDLDFSDYSARIRDIFEEILREVMAIKAKDFETPPVFLHVLTKYPGVSLPENIMREYPEDIILLFDKVYSDLRLHAENLTVRLSFRSRESDVTIPYDAVYGIQRGDTGDEIMSTPPKIPEPKIEIVEDIASLGEVIPFKKRRDEQ